MKVYFLGFLLIFAGVVVLVIAASVHGLSGSFGLVVFIGSIPIILGTGEYALLAVALAIILTVLGIVLFMMLSPSKDETAFIKNGLREKRENYLNPVVKFHLRT